MELYYPFHIFCHFRAGLVHVTVPLEMCLYLLKEQDYVPWAMALKHLGNIHK